MTRWRIAGRTGGKAEGGSRSNQDCWDGERRPGRIRVAVADGATQAFAAGPWAQMLVAAFIGGTLSPNRSTDRLLDATQDLATVWKSQHTLGPDAPWHQEARALRGGAATLVGLELRGRGRRWSWTTLAVGDANLLVVRRDGSVRRSFPLQHGAFEAGPQLLSTRRTRNEQLRQVRMRAKGSYEPGDTFLLASDAVAWWLLDTSEHGAIDVKTLVAAVRSRHAFNRFMTDLRAMGVPDDDMTLVVVRRS